MDQGGGVWGAGGGHGGERRVGGVGEAWRGGGGGQHAHNGAHSLDFLGDYFSNRNSGSTSIQMKKRCDDFKIRNWNSLHSQYDDDVNTAWWRWYAEKRNIEDKGLRATVAAFQPGSCVGRSVVWYQCWCPVASTCQSPSSSTSWSTSSLGHSWP